MNPTYASTKQVIYACYLLTNCRTTRKEFTRVVCFTATSFKLRIHSVMVALYAETCRIKLTILSYMLYVHLVGILNENISFYMFYHNFKFCGLIISIIESC